MRRDRAAIFATRFLELTLAILATATTLLAQEMPQGWVGKRVVQRANRFQLRGGTGNAEGERGFYRVERINGPLLWLHGIGAEGYALATEVVPVEDAITYYNEYIRGNPHDPFGYHIRAFLWRELRNELDLALADNNTQIRLEPRKATGYNDRGMTWMAKKNHDKAIADFNRAVELDPKYAFAYANRGLVWSDRKEYGRAFTDFETAIKLDPRSPLVYVFRGLAWSKNNRQDKAVADFSEAVRLDPNFSLAYSNRGYTWARTNQHERAIADLSEAIKLDPKDSRSYNNRGNVWYAKKDYAKAFTDYDQAIRLDPGLASAYSNRGKVLAAEKAYERAITDLDQAIRLDPKDAGAYFYRAVLALISNREGAERNARAAIDLTGWRNPPATYAVLVGHFGAKRLGQEAAKRLLDEGARQCDSTAWPFPVIRFLRREIDESSLLTLAVDDNKRTEARCYLGLDHLLAGRPDPAREHFRWVKEHGTTSFSEYTIAVAELDRLEAKAKP